MVIRTPKIVKEMEKDMIERFIDFIQASLLLSEATVIMKGYAPLPAIRFYKRGYQHPRGYRLYFGNPNSARALIVASGQTMQSLRNDFLDAEILDHILTLGGEVTRLDLAVTDWNTFDGMIELGDIEKWVSEGLIEAEGLSGQAKTISSLAFGGRKDLETLYIGDMKKRGKKGFFEPTTKD